MNKDKSYINLMFEYKIIDNNIIDNILNNIIMSPNIILFF